ncbi:MAG: hypothetical protein ACOY99_09505 [Pseudomonadota bacterium]
MGRIAAIVAAFALLSIQFVHAAVLDGVATHAHAPMIDHSDDHDGQHLDNLNGDMGGDDLASLHKSLHDQNSTTFIILGFVASFANMASGKKLPWHGAFARGLAHSPPVPPPLF